MDAFEDYLARVVSKANGNEMNVNLTAVSVGDKVSITRPGTPPELPGTLPEFVEGVRSECLTFLFVNISGESVDQCGHLFDLGSR